MKIENLSAKRFFIKCKDGDFSLLPASGVVELLDCEAKDYVRALAKAGHIRIHEDLKDEDIEDAVIVEDPLSELRDEYESLSGKSADGRWSEDKLRLKVKELLESSDKED